MTTVAGVDWAGTAWFAVVLEVDADGGSDPAGEADADATASDATAPDPNAATLDPDATTLDPDAIDAGLLADVDAETAVGAGTDAYPSLLNVVYETGADVVLVDIPVGLPAADVRACDAAARAFLGGDRAASVFPTPCREAVYAPSYDEAKEVNEVRTGRSVTVQAWNIVPRIREADALLAAVPPARDVVREAHPEVCFHALAGGAVAHPKTTDEGVAERLSAVETVASDLPALYDALVERFVTGPAPHARRLPADAADDVLDALGLAATALVGTGGGATSETGSWSLATLPADPPTDGEGLPMEIVYPEQG